MTLRAAIFDMDGLLVDSEPLWHRAEVEILGARGVPLRLEDVRETKGMFVNEVTRFWHERYPWSGDDPDQVAETVVDAVIDLVVTEGELQPGVHRAIEECQRRDLALAIASSSQYRLIDRVLDHFDLRRFFPVVHSAEDEPYGKPHPAVFLSAAAKLGVAPDACVVWEDAAAGVLAAKAARMVCVAVPEPAERARRSFAIADVILGSLEEIDDAAWTVLEAARSGPDPGVVH